MNSTYTIIALLAVWASLLSFFLARLLIHYRRLTQNAQKKELMQIWEEYLAVAQRNQSEIKRLEIELGRLQKASRDHLQRIGVVRFNPFHELGGNQSFALAILDEKGDGMVISSLHGRESTRVYAKPVKGFEAHGFELSAEEKDAIHHCQNTKS